MPFKCALCGLSFETPDDFVKHKLAHQQQQEKPEKKGLTCLRCGKPIPNNFYGPNYKGVISCPDCRQTMKVVMVNGEVEFAMSQGGAEQTKEELLNQYRKWVLEYNKVKDLIDSLVPVPAALSEGGKMPVITITEDLLAKFQYAEATMGAALREIQQIHEKLHRL
jgi:DNA-directed RNA polymerase subunit RPC12/RpoP